MHVNNNNNTFFDYSDHILDNLMRVNNQIKLKITYIVLNNYY